MFGFFNRQKKTATNVLAAAENASRVIRDFAELTRSAAIQPTMVYDVAKLPHPKPLIEKACMFCIQASTEPEQREGFSVMLLALAQFQDGVGAHPLGMNVPALVSAKHDPATMIAAAAQSRMPSAEIQAKVRADEQRFLAWIAESMKR